ALGRELYERIAVLGDHWAGVGKNLNDAVAAYNKSVATLESRVLVTARKFQELKVTGEDKEIRDLIPIETQPRAVQAIELLPKNEDVTEK
ncbi:MAG: DNA recombination protein RmuC, partial [Rugosibacter sp.]